ACGVVRNNYFQPAMSELMQACVEVWESDPAAYHYNPVGYVALGAAVQESDLTAVAERHEQIGYRSELILGERSVDEHMKALFPDWRARGVTVCLHEKQGGFAFNMASVIGLVEKCESEDVTILSEVEVLGLEPGADDVVDALITSRGRIEVGEQVVLAPGPWAKQFWAMLGMPMRIDIRTPSGEVLPDRPMWTYWNLQEGEISVEPTIFATASGDAPPVIHLDSDAPLYTDDGDLVTDELWGIYFKRDRDGIQGGASPLTVGEEVELDPYPQTTDVDPGFADMWCAALSHAMSRFEGCRAVYKNARSGGVGAFTADNFPVFDYVKPNIYGIFDSNHGYKMIGVGREVAKVVVGDHSSLLYPFRYERFESGDLHPVSSSPYPWS
ncbi:MAG TPA: FAD-binding oxidoreductase, partial [Gaiellaceae bacterium]|nr:FAD-binding oxidoreductase [Gaiellaceae bacterium]